jgi:hypothetical protein
LLLIDFIIKNQPFLNSELKIIKNIVKTFFEFFTVFYRYSAATIQNIYVQSLSSDNDKLVNGLKKLNFDIMFSNDFSVIKPDQQRFFLNLKGLSFFEILSLNESVINEAKNYIEDQVEACKEKIDKMYKMTESLQISQDLVEGGCINNINKTILTKCLNNKEQHPNHQNLRGDGLQIINLLNKLEELKKKPFVNQLIKDNKTFVNQSIEDIKNYLNDENIKDFLDYILNINKCQNAIEVLDNDLMMCLLDPESFEFTFNGVNGTLDNILYDLEFIYELVGECTSNNIVGGKPHRRRYGKKHIKNLLLLKLLKKKKRKTD